MISEIRAILNEVPLGKYKLEIGLKLRQAMLINGILYNSEAWHSLSEQDILSLQRVDEMLLRYLLNSHSKVPTEFLYLESGALPIKFIIASRRMNYCQTILKRDDEELTKRILLAQVNDPTNGDFIELVKADFLMADIEFNVNTIETINVDHFKKQVKMKIKEAAHKHLVAKQQTHSKIRYIEFKELRIQPYLQSPLFSDEEANLLFALRSRTHEMFKANFRNMYGNVVWCPLKCTGESDVKEEDTQQHLLNCETLGNLVHTDEVANGNVKYSDIFADIKKQKEAVVLLHRLIEARTEYQKAENNPPGADLDPSMGTRSYCSDTLFTSVYCINCISIGK